MSQTAKPAFSNAAFGALKDIQLQTALDGGMTRAVNGRVAAMGETSDAPALLHLGLYSPVLLALYLLALRSVFAHERAMKLPDIAAAPGTPPEPHREVGPFLMAAAVVLAAGTWLPVSYTHLTLPTSDLV